MAEAKNQPKLHWYLLAFVVPSPGHVAHASMFMSSVKQALNLPSLQAARQQHGIPDGSTMVGCSYLGRMTQDEMNPPPEVVPNLIAPTEDYMDGYHAATVMRAEGNTPPANPHSVPGEGLSQEGIEWAEGFMAACKRYGAVGKNDL